MNLPDSPPRRQDHDSDLIVRCDKAPFVPDYIIAQRPRGVVTGRMGRLHEFIRKATFLYGDLLLRELVPALTTPETATLSHQ